MFSLCSRRSLALAPKLRNAPKVLPLARIRPALQKSTRSYGSSPSPQPSQATQALEETDALHSGDRFAQVPSRSIVQVSGDDASKFLQGLITNHMPMIDQGGSGFFTCFLAPQGRVLFDAFVYPKNFGSSFPHQVFLIETDKRAKDTLLKVLKFYKLRSRVEIADVSDEYGVWSVWGPGQESIVGQPDKPIKHLPRGSLIFKEDEIEGARVWLHDHRTPDMGLRFLLAAGSKPTLPQSFQQLESDEYILRRILKGVAEGIDDFVPNQSLPLECNLDYMHGVDFNKGCYLGQELTIRTHHRGVVRKRLVPIIVSSMLSDQTPRLDRNTSLQLPPPQSDINWIDIPPQNAGSATDSETQPCRRRPRKTSPAKLASTKFNAGLALMRLEQIEEFTSHNSDQAPQRAHAFVLNDHQDNKLYAHPMIPSWWRKC